MKEKIQNFKTEDFYTASVELFKKLSIPLDSITKLAIEPSDIFEEQKPFFEKIENIYALGMISDTLFSNRETNFDFNNKKDYEAILIFAVELNDKKPNRTLLANITRAFNREYHYTPVIVLFKYGNFLSLANTQRLKYKIDKVGEKIGKVSILRDIDIENPHRGHLDILKSMKIDSKINSYESLYRHWQEVFDISLLNKKFYQELSNWYSYAIKEVTFPSQPKDTDAQAIEVHKSQNVIRLLTRFLFVWFIKEKGLIPEQLFEEDYIKTILKEFNPKNMDNTLFNGLDKSSVYYKAILQNLFFASLNCPIEPLDRYDTRKRGFRKKEHYGQHRDANFLMRYEDSFHNPQEFLELINEYVPFLNGGLFECLDDKTNGIYIDGFSDNLPKQHQLIVPDYLFFGIEEHVDLSAWYGSKKKAFKDATVKGLINILKSYKFTVTENTPIEEDVALDPELLGRVFENLLASYNPETKTTARKQTGSFYTPREIVSYMVDESIIAYLKTQIEDEFNYDNLESDLRKLCSYSNIQPFRNEKIISKIITSLDKLKALDPAVGSGAFPMGMLQKLVHILTKLDPKNEYWYELQLQKAQKESNEAFETKDKLEREKLLMEINDIFDETINNPDYARKLYIIENSIYGVDIQPIAIQISKLRFFISLVIEQKIDKTKPNFGIRPLPNLETKFISANTLIGINNKENSLIDFDETIKQFEKELKNIRHRLFNAKTPQTKRKLREKDKELREKISQELLKSGWDKDTAEKLAHWDPYDQNASSEFFDMEWMFGISNGFDIVIGNPPYVSAVSMARSIQEKKLFKKLYPLAIGTYDIYILFLLKGIELLNKTGKYLWIIPNKFLIADYAIKTKKYLENNGLVYSIDVSTFNVFENASVYPIIIFGDKKNNQGFKEFLLKNYEDLEIRNFQKPLKLTTHNTFKDFNIKIASGATGFEAQKIKSLVTDKRMKNTIPFTVSGGIYKYTYTNKNIKYMKSKFDVAYIKKSDIIADSKWHLWENRKIIIAGMTKNIRAAYVEEPLGLGVGTYAIYDFGNFNPYFLIAILNSKYLTFYLINKFKDKHLAGGYLAINKSTIEKLPLVYTKNQKPFEILVDYIMWLKSNKDKSINEYVDNEFIATEFEKVIDAMVYELYFEKELQNKELYFIKYAEQYFKSIENENNENIPKIIHRAYQSLRERDNEIRNNLKLLTIRLKDLILPIEKSV